MTDYSSMSTEELEKSNIELSNQIDTLRDEQLLINTELDKRESEKRAREALESMTETDKLALKEQLKD